MKRKPKKSIVIRREPTVEFTFVHHSAKAETETVAALVKHIQESRND